MLQQGWCASQEGLIALIQLHRMASADSFTHALPVWLRYLPASLLQQACLNPLLQAGTWCRMGRRGDDPAAEQHSASLAMDRLRFESKASTSGQPRSMAPRQHTTSTSRTVVPLVDPAHHHLQTAKPGHRFAELCPGKVLPRSTYSTLRRAACPHCHGGHHAGNKQCAVGVLLRAGLQPIVTCRAVLRTCMATQGEGPAPL